MEEEIKFITGEASKRAITEVHHSGGLVAPIIPKHLVPALKGIDGNYSQCANFPWDPMACYMLEFEVPGVPIAYLEHGMKMDYFGSGCRSNGYNTMGGIIVCSGGIFLSQQDMLNAYGSTEDEPSSYNESMEAFNMYLAPLMNRPGYKPSVAIIYSEYRRDFCLFSTIKESWGAWNTESVRSTESKWNLPSGWGMVGEISDDGYVGWLHVVLAGNFSEELSAACRYLLNLKRQLDEVEEFRRSTDTPRTYGD